MLSKTDLKLLLDENVERFNQSNFIEDDPISIPHQFTNKKDIEIIAFLVATIAWGNRKSIIKNGNQLVNIMGESPHDFILNASKKDIQEFEFVHRTFNTLDLQFFISSLQNLYKNGSSLEALFSKGSNTKDRIINFRKSFLETEHLTRSEKHISNPAKNSAAKRINMYLRWMVRKDKKGVDFGVWNNIPTSELMIPLDVHTGNVSRDLGLINRKSNDWKALEELMTNLRQLDSEDPCRYDFALFGIGVNKLFK